MSEIGNATEAQEFRAPFRVDPIGIARKAEQEALMPTEEQLDAVITAAETAGAVAVDSEIDRSVA